jgi:hypothetical protein
MPDHIVTSMSRTLRLTLVDDARVELDCDRVADDVAEKTGRVLALALRNGTVLHGDETGVVCLGI